jgi:hypothetical protein
MVDAVAQVYFSKALGPTPKRFSTGSPQTPSQIEHRYKVKGTIAIAVYEAATERSPRHE